MSRRAGALAAAWRIAIAAGVATIAGALANFAAAQERGQTRAGGRSWAVAELPQGGAPAAGFTATIRLGADQHLGYLPVRITVEAAGGFPADRQLTVRIASSPGGYAPPTNGLLVDLPIRVAEGSRSATFVRYLPKYSLGDAFDVSVRQQGRALSGYRAELGDLIRDPAATLTPALQREHQAEFAWIGTPSNEKGASPSDVRALVTASFRDLGRLLPPTGPLDQAAWNQVEQSGLLTFMGADQMPADWRGYQTFDAVVVPAAVLQSLSSGADDRLAPLRDWGRCGGTIVVLGAEDPESLGGALPLGDTASSDAQAWDQLARASEDFASAWRERFESLDQQFRNGPPPTFLPPSGPAGPAGPLGHPASPEDRQHYAAYAEHFDAELNRRDSDWHRAVWRRTFGAGQVIGIGRGADDRPPSLLHWMLVQRLIGHRASPMLRRGVDPMLGDNRYRDWLIPGVAEPPVYTFMGLLAVFVILVGPVAYRQTARRGRSYLMFAIAPALALVTTLSMFVYGVFADGFGTHARIRQLTWIDGASGDAAEWVRATYFAGIRPGDGLSFPGGAEVFPYPYHRRTTWQRLNQQDSERMGQVTITGRRQVFSSAFLPSREQRQFVTQRPRRGVGRVTLQRIDSGEPQPREPQPRERQPGAAMVHSTLGYDLRDVVIRDHQGDYWQLSRLPAGAQGQRCASLSADEVARQLAELYRLQRPLAEGVSEMTGRRRPRGGTRDLLSRLEQDLADHRTSTGGLLESWLREHLQVGGELPRGWFIAAAEVGEETAAVDSAELTESIHYVFGTLP